MGVRAIEPVPGSPGPILPGRSALPGPLGTGGRIALGLALAVGVVSVLLAPIAVGIDSAARIADRSLVPRIAKPLRLPPLPERSSIYAADGTLLQHLFLNFNREVVPLSRYNRITRRAVLAIEDHNFYRHGALDVLSILRAAIVDLAAGRIVEGGSTITQQLVKNTVTGDAQTLQRKVREAFDAIRLERAYSKDRILGMYLNQVYLGNGVYGLATGAQYYFDERPEQLTLAQAALLAGMIESPTYYDPIRRPALALERRNEVLSRMRDLGWISPARYRRAVATPIRLSKAGRGEARSGPRSFFEQYVIESFLSNPAFGETVRDRMRALFQGGLKITTTLDPELQREAVQVLKDRMGGPGMPQSALVSIVPSTGAVRAMAVGNWGYARHQYNLATDPGGGRTAGSAFKAFTLAAALEAGISPNAVYNGDSPKTIPNCGGGETWTVSNAEPGSGNYPLWLATADSVNVVFAQVIDQVGPDAVAKVAHRMGITSHLTPVCPLTLGTSPVSPLEMTSAYATLANGGIHCDPNPIAEVVSSTGQVIYRARPECHRALPSDVAAEETSMLEGVIRFGTGTAADIGRPAAGKTGTGQNYQDAWFVGYVPQLATGVWVGYAKGEVPMPSVPGYGAGFGGTLAAPIWHDFMLFATRTMRVLDFPPAPVSFAQPSPSPTASPSSPGSSSPGPTATPPPVPPPTPSPSPLPPPTPSPTPSPSPSPPPTP
ncbi:MAG TPA: transglycosylase domain-containing protein [Actinomycetota bacterium]|nr:transglycosylase domain-containing protein [Actinomycetota bacterium]